MPRRVAQISREYESLRASFQQLAQSIGRIGSMLAQAAAVDGVARQARRPRSRRKPRLTPSRHAALRLQGKYIGSIRGLPPRKKAKVKKIRAERGVRAAIAAARRLTARP